MVLVVATDFIGFCGYPLFFGCLLVTKQRRVSIFMIGCSTNSIILRMLVRKGEISLSFTTGMEFPNGMKLSFCSGKVVSVYVD